MTDILYLKIEEISGYNRIGVYHLDVPYGEELEHEVEDIMGKLQSLNFPYTDRRHYRICYATTTKGIVTSAGVIYAKLVTTEGEPDDLEDRVDNDDEHGIFVWDVIVCKDSNDDFQIF